MPAKSLEQVRNLCMRRGFVFPGSAAYGGVASFWDYGPLGAEMLNNVKRAWWQDAVYARDDMEGLDAAVLMSRKVWQHSGHEATFGDALVEDRKSNRRYRLDHLLEAQHQVALAEFFREVYQSINDEEGWRTRIVDVTPVWMNVAGVWDDMSARYESQIKCIAHPSSNTGWILDQIGALAGDMLSKDDKAALVRAWLPALLASSQEYSAPPNVGELMTRGKVTVPETGTVGEWSAPRRFMGMFVSHAGPVQADPGTAEELASRVYLRPETAQGIFMNFAHVQRSMARKIPFGIAQMGKAFRNEITPGNFIFRTREFEQMEIEFFIKPAQFAQPGEKNDEQWHAEWVEQRFKWWLRYASPAGNPAGNGRGLGSSTPDQESTATGEATRATRFRKRAQTADELAHYAKATTDIEYLFPGSLGWGEIEGVANRTDFDLSAHSKDIPPEDLKRLKLEANTDSVEKFDYFDPDLKQRYIPWVIEPSAGVTRAVLTFLCEAYHEELVKEPTKQEIDQIKSDEAMIRKNAEKKIKEAEKDIKDGKEPKHNPVKVTAFLAQFADVLSRLPASLDEVLLTLDHEGAQNLELVKKFRVPTEKFIEDCMRTVLRLHPALAPIKLAVFPLKKNKPELVELAQKIKQTFQKKFRTVYDDSAGIGKLYRRQDEIGTPYCVTVDFESLEDQTVTVRERDTMAQERVKVEDLPVYLAARLE